jgi:hypothetical protein
MERYDNERLDEFSYRLDQRLKYLKNKEKETGIIENEYYFLHMKYSSVIRNINMSNIDRIMNKTKYKFNAYK